MDIYDYISQESCESIKNRIEKRIEDRDYYFSGTTENMIVENVAYLGKTQNMAIKNLKHGEVLIIVRPNKYLYPKDDEIRMVGHLSNAIYIVDDKVNAIEILIELEPPIQNLDTEQYFSKNGVLSKMFEGYEYRKEQLNMARCIDTGINNEQPVVVEAGTGTGKTLAYLIPAIQWALNNDKKVIVTTNTINLQEQLLDKDIPIVKEALGRDFKAGIIKGRNNYLCNKKYNDAVFDSPRDLTAKQIEQYGKIIDWGNKTETGDKNELKEEFDNSVWDMFSIEADMCANKKCPHFKECFFYKARKEKQNMDVLITNHSLYFSDLKIRQENGFMSDYGILPHYDLVVFDEAHNITKVARNYFSQKISEYSFKRMMNALYIKSKKNTKNTLFYKVKDLLMNENNIDIKKYGIDKIELEHIKLVESGANYFNLVKDTLLNIDPVNEYDKKKKSKSIRIKKNNSYSNKLITSVEPKYKEFLDHCNTYNTLVRNFIKDIRNITTLEDKNNIVDDYERGFSKFNNFFNTLEEINQLDDDDYIYWIEANKYEKGSNVSFIATPLKINELMKQNLYDNLKNLVFTSATIAIKNDFKYFKDSIGLNNEKVKEEVIHSPFDYNNNMVAYIPTDLPKTESNKAIATFIFNEILATKGKTFVLFTANNTLYWIGNELRNDLERNGMTVFIQGDYNRSELVEKFKNAKNPVLFGTSSFWEGVDIKGEQLSNVIITKLPFGVPSDPINSAISEYLEKKGKNKFKEFSLPEAIIKFKQGIGRLIRSKTDSGTITILDDRIIKMWYGKNFIDALPTENIKKLTQKEIIEELKNKNR